MPILQNNKKTKIYNIFKMNISKIYNNQMKSINNQKMIVKINIFNHLIN